VLEGMLEVVPELEGEELQKSELQIPFRLQIMQKSDFW
jgi:hypothetical protein